MNLWATILTGRLSGAATTVLTPSPDILDNDAKTKEGPRVITISAWQWSFEPGECEYCGAFVLRLVRCQLYHTPWWCDGCIEHYKCD
jgi:hypothetical protein